MLDLVNQHRGRRATHSKPSARLPNVIKLGAGAPAIRQDGPPVALFPHWCSESVNLVEQVDSITLVQAIKTSLLKTPACNSADCSPAGLYPPFVHLYAFLLTLLWAMDCRHWGEDIYLPQHNQQENRLHRAQTLQTDTIISTSNYGNKPATSDTKLEEHCSLKYCCLQEDFPSVKIWELDQTMKRRLNTLSVFMQLWLWLQLLSEKFW